MTAKEKAKHLINKNYQPLGYLGVGKNHNSQQMWDYAKDRARECVDEILNICLSDISKYFWQEVKQEIQKL